MVANEVCVMAACCMISIVYPSFMSIISGRLQSCTQYAMTFARSAAGATRCSACSAVMCFGLTGSFWCAPPSTSCATLFRLLPLSRCVLLASQTSPSTCSVRFPTSTRPLRPTFMGVMRPWHGAPSSTWRCA